MNLFPTMEWNSKWDWENLDSLSSKYGEIPMMLRSTTDWGIEEGGIDAGSFNLSGDCDGSGGCASDVGNVSSAKSSISASTDCSSKERRNASNFALDTLKGFSGDFSKTKELPRSEVAGTSPCLDTSVSSADLMGLKLGKRTYFEKSSAGSNAKTSSFSVIPAASASTAKKLRPACQNATTPRCQVDACNLDLSSAKDYQQKHKVCESHSKCPRVIVGGLERRFCQQCSRFHSLSEFDEKKRSCRKRLSNHNARRRKQQRETIQFNTTSLSSSIYEGGKQMSFALNNAPLAQTRRAGNSTWGSTHGFKYALAKGNLLKPEKAGIFGMQHHLPRTQLPHAISMPNHDLSRLLKCTGSSEAFSQVTGFRESMFSSDLDAAADLRRALSLLSTNSWGSYEPESVSLNHTMNITHTSMPQHVMHAVHQGLPLAAAECWQTEVQLSDARMHALAANCSGNGSYQGIQPFTAPYDSGFYSN